MNEFNEYDEQQDITNQPKQTKKHSFGSQTLIIIQLILCGLIIISAFMVKLIGGSVYAIVGTWFYDNYNNSVFTDTQDNIFSFIDGTKTSEKNEINLNNNSKTNTDIINKIKADIKKPLQSGSITSGFGNRSDGDTNEFHKGIDIVSEKGAQICAILEGTVTVSKEDDSYGKYIVLTHSNGIQTLYAHCSELCVKEGEKINAGQKIALVGSTGDSSGNHLHLEIIINGENADPAEILGKEYG